MTQRIRTTGSRPLTTMIAYDLGKTLAAETAQWVNPSEIKPMKDAAVPPGNIGFDPPYKLEAGKVYGMRVVDGRPQMWEIRRDAGLVPKDSDWINEAERHERVAVN